MFAHIPGQGVTMALFKNGIIGTINGRVGNLVFRKPNEKDFISIRPRKYKKSQSISLNRERTKFAFISKFASFINADPILSQTWHQSTINSTSVFHEILKPILILPRKEC